MSPLILFINKNNRYINLDCLSERFEIRKIRSTIVENLKNISYGNMSYGSADNLYPNLTCDEYTFY